MYAWRKLGVGRLVGGGVNTWGPLLCDSSHTWPRAQSGNNSDTDVFTLLIPEFYYNIVYKYTTESIDLIELEYKAGGKQFLLCTVMLVRAHVFIYLLTYS